MAHAPLTASPGETPGLCPHPDFDVVIAHRGPWQNLWFTISSCEMALPDDTLRPRYVVVANGPDTQIEKPMRTLFEKFSDAGRLELVTVQEPLSPPAARQLGAAHGKAEFIFFFDNHVLIQQDYFVRALSQMISKHIDVLHSSWNYLPRQMVYHYQVNDYLESRESFEPLHRSEPYRCAASGHGGFVVRRRLWEKLGGYWNGFRGYAGEELYWDFKVWLSGHEVWLDPKLVHYHLPGSRSYARHHSPDCPLNILMCANIIGGREVARALYKRLRRVPLTANYDLSPIYREALERSNAHAEELQHSFIRTYNEQLRWFTNHGIPY